MLEEFEYHIRSTRFNEKGYRYEFEFEDGLVNFFTEKNTVLEVIEDLDYNLQYEGKGKLCMSQESGFIHVFFEEGKFTELDCVRVIEGFIKELKSFFGEDVEYFRSN